jgi:hypothetical protein
MTRRVEIVVDELVVRGLSPEAARAAAESFEARLTELASSDVDIRERVEHSRRLPPVDVPVGDVGPAVAGALWSALSGRAAP